MIAIVEVAALAAKAGGVPGIVTITGFFGALEIPSAFQCFIRSQRD
jgi:hypothetical protein